MEPVHFEMRPHSGVRRTVLFSPLWEPYEFIWIINPNICVGGKLKGS